MAERKPKSDNQPEDPIFIWDAEHPGQEVPDWLKETLEQAERDYQEALRRQQETDPEGEDA